MSAPAAMVGREIGDPGGEVHGGAEGQRGQGERRCLAEPLGGLWPPVCVPDPLNYQRWGHGPVPTATGSSAPQTTGSSGFPKRKARL